MDFKRTLILIILLFPLFFLISVPPAAVAGIKGTKHDLSVSGPGTVKAVNENQVCIFCHTPHNANPAYPLWNHEISTVNNYINYWSPTLQSYTAAAAAPPIDGFSRLCLSCHDGTVGVASIEGDVREDIRMVTIPGVIESGKLKSGAAGYLGTDLSGGHPISILYDEALVTRRNASPTLMHLNGNIKKFGEKSGGDPDVMIYPTQGGYGVQCPSCHDPHGSKGGSGAPPLWRKSTYEDVCAVCHILPVPGVGAPGTGH